MPYDVTTGAYILPTIEITAEPYQGTVPGSLPAIEPSSASAAVPSNTGFWYNFDTALNTLFGGAEKTLGLYTAYEYAQQKARTGQVLTSPEQPAGQTYLMGQAFGQGGILWIVILVGLVVVLLFAIKV